MHPSRELRNRRGRTNVMWRRVPTPSYRHAAPSHPWPWIDLNETNSETDLNCGAPATLGSCGHDDCEDCKNWISYPQSLFGNWTIVPVEKCGIARAVKDREHSSVVYRVDVLDSGVFQGSGQYKITTRNKREYWRDVLMTDREPGIRVRALMIDNMSGPVLQMFGTKYVVEPFFFSSALNWIPSRYAENVHSKEGDHITITLTFLRCMDYSEDLNSSSSSTLTGGTTKSGSRVGTSLLSHLPSWSYFSNPSGENETIDTRAPLYLHSDKKLLLLDLLAIHMIRKTDSSTILTYHPDRDWCATSAEELQGRLKLVGRSVYWQNIFQQSVDPTFVFLALLWHAMYAWDEALEVLYAHFCWLESRVIITNDMALTQELHVIRAHLLHYTSLLDDFRKSVLFIRGTPNPAMDADSIDEYIRTSDKELLYKECDNLLAEIDRLEMNRSMQDKRLQNVMHLVFASVNITDSKAMKRVSYLTMVFLPATFVAGIFGMNVKEFDKNTRGTIPHYLETAISLTLLTVWVVVALQSRYFLRDPESSAWRRMLWPVTFLITLFCWRRNKRADEEAREEKEAMFLGLPRAMV